MIIFCMFIRYVEKKKEKKVYTYIKSKTRKKDDDKVSPLKFHIKWGMVA